MWPNAGNINPGILVPGLGREICIEWGRIAEGQDRPRQKHPDSEASVFQHVRRE
jgi:hypothetical protein